MSNGGTIKVLNPEGVSLSVTITPDTTFIMSDDGTASFPETVTATEETFETSVDGAYTISVKYAGSEIASETDTTVAVYLHSDAQYIFSPSPEHGFATFPGGITSTTTALEDVDAAINTTGKYVGKMVFNTTTGLPLWADTAAADGTWSLATGVATHTPV
jgi:hypothetical protein